MKAQASARYVRQSPFKVRQVLDLIVAGRLNKQIAAELGAAEKTVKVHRGRVMRKMGARTAAELADLRGTGEVAGARRRPSGRLCGSRQPGWISAVSAIPHRIAIVDDGEKVRRALARLVRALGLGATTFASGEALLEGAAGAAQDLALLDLHLHDAEADVIPAKGCL